MRGKITKRTVDAGRAGQSDQFLWDTDLKGFGLKITPAGSRVYILQYRRGGRGAPTKRVTIGRHGALTPEEARKQAARLARTLLRPGAIQRPPGRRRRALPRLPIWRHGT
jgi:hypothetical protein